MADLSSDRIVITVLGSNRSGIVAAVTSLLAEEQVDIRDITQSILGGVFTMTMLASLADASCDFAHLQSRLEELGEREGLHIYLQREDVFDFMHRL